MKTHRGIVLACAIVGAVSCTTTPYYYDPYYGYYPVIYDDPYYAYIVVGGYYYYPGYYYYDYHPRAATTVSAVPPSVRLLLDRWKVPFDASCLDATASPDADGDGIPASSTLTFSCSSKASGGTAQATGAVTITDLDDTTKDAGYTLAFDGFTIRVVSATGTLTERVFHGTDAVAKSDGGTLQVTRDLTTDNTDTYADGVERKSKLEMKATGTLAPEPVAAGAPVTRGTLTMSGQGTFTAADGTVTTLTGQTDPTLHWNNDCSREANNQGFDGGAVVYRTSQGRQTRIVYESCTQTTTTNTTVPTP